MLFSSASLYKDDTTKYPITGFSPFFGGDAPDRLWRKFFPCLIAALILRVWVGVSGDWHIRADEIFQYLEQAHRLVFGYGQVPWEFRVGARSWLIPMIPALPLWLCKLTGFGYPDVYIPAVKIWNAALSLSIPIGMYAFARRTVGETAARLALLFGCFWHEFIILASHTFAEQYASVVFFLALALITPAASTARLITISLLLGFTITLRLPYLPLVGAFGLALLAAYPLHRWAWLVVGGIIALLFWGLCDYLTWGRWWHSPRIYADIFVFNNVFANLDILHRGNRFNHLSFMAISSFGLYIAVLITVPWWRHYWMLLAPAAIVMIFHVAIKNQEYTNLFILFPLLWILIAVATTHITQYAARNRLSWLRFAPKIAVSAMVCVTLTIFAYGVPNTIRTYGYTQNPANTWPIHSETSMLVNRWLSAQPTDTVSAILWDTNQVSVYYASGYYYIHHRVPIVFPFSLDEHYLMVEKTNPANFSHIIAEKNARYPGFVRVQEIGPLVIFAALSPLTENISDNYNTDIHTSTTINIEQKIKRLGIYHFPSSPALLNEDFTF